MSIAVVGCGACIGDDGKAGLFEIVTPTSADCSPEAGHGGIGASLSAAASNGIVGNNPNYYGAGGGGVGRIRINTQSGQLDHTGYLITPEPSVDCISVRL